MRKQLIAFDRIVKLSTLKFANSSTFHLNGGWRELFDYSNFVNWKKQLVFLNRNKLPKLIQDYSIS